MSPLNNKGIALVTALMLTLITLVIILGIMYTITNNIQSSAANKSYRNVSEATYGGTNLVVQDIIPRLFQNVSTATLGDIHNYKGLGMLFGSSACIRTKLLNPVSAWGLCSSVPNAKTQPDIQFKLGSTSGQSYTVYSKIIDTVPGVPYPTAPAGGQLLGGGVTESSSATTTNLNHYVYRIEVAGENTVNPTQKTNLSVLYEY
jgi:hypothetical protein